jgi:hypothetical protein
MDRSGAYYNILRTATGGGAGRRHHGAATTQQRNKTGDGLETKELDRDTHLPVASSGSPAEARSFLRVAMVKGAVVFTVCC